MAMHQQFLSRVYRRYRRELHRYVRSHFRWATSDAQDVVQQTFVQLSALDDPQNVRNPRAFLYRTAINALIDAGRANERQARLLDSTLVVLRAECNEVCPQRVAVAREEVALLQRAVAKLSSRDRTFLLLNRIDGVSIAQIARDARMSPSGVRFVIEQALAACEAALARGQIRRSDDQVGGRSTQLTRSGTRRPRR